MNTDVASHADDFGADLRRAVAVWPRQPLLPIISMVWWTLPGSGSGNDAVSFAVGIVALVCFGWPGTEREWYRRAFAGGGLAPSEIWPTTRRFFGPFFRLALVLSPIGIALVALSAWSEGAAVVDVAVTLVLVFILDVVLTFVTPALTFTTSSARTALSVGLAMLRRHWPAAAPYALTPALVVIFGTQTVIEALIGPGGAVIATALAGLLALALKGATVAFYLRHPPAPST